MINVTHAGRKFWPMLFVLLAAAFLFTVQSCKKSRSDLGQALSKESKNKVFKDVTYEGFAEVFQKVLASKKIRMANPKLITAFYENNEYEPVFLLKHLPKDGLKTVLSYYQKAGEHGLDPKMFQAAEVDALLKQFYDKKAIKTLDQAYEIMAELEITTANSLINYSNALQYGVISPRKIYARYFTQTKRPDSTSMLQVFAIKDVKGYLDSIQPKSEQYKALQQALAQGAQAPGMSKEESERIIKVNLERLRWKNKPTQNKYVIVNIPDYTLDVMENGKSVMNMKVCVGEGRNNDRADNLAEYDESDKVDRPFSRETPQLNSMIHSVQVNPVWNIPKSIASKEIMVEAAKDPYYLANHNMDAYQKGQKIEDPETIDWSTASADDYEFKQRPGEDNALGKIKFLFNNSSSVYLHDTPAKLAFNKPIRAVSHGCVRVERPLDLANALFGNGSKFQDIKTRMGEENPTAEDISLKPKVPVYLTYVTCWVDSKGIIQFRRDVYGLDIVLYGHMQRFLTA
jgi:murein L,D-transpeptidase YcbB/YkuD